MKITRFIIVTALALSSSALKGQDTLLMKSGQKIASQITEVSPTAVRYKKADNPDGPSYVVNASDIYIIKYRNGAMDTLKAASTPEPVVVKIPTPAATSVASKMAVDPNPPITPAGMNYRYGSRRIGKREMYDVLENMNDPEINLHVKKARTAKGIEYLGFVAIPAVAFGAIYTVVAQISNSGGDNGLSYAPGAIGFGVAAATFATSITFKIIGRNHREAAIKMYNEKY